MRYADFPTLVDALDYAALSSAGMNFYDRRCQLEDQLEYQTLKARAEAGAKRLLSLNLKKGDRVALIAETSSGFVEAFFACQYAGLVAVPLAIPMGVGQRDSWSAKLQGLLASCQPAAIITGDEWLPLVNAATHDNPELHVLSHAWFKALPEADVALQRPVPNDIAYLQYTSGSTRFPRGVIITHREVMANLRAISHDGIKLRPGDRCVSWLPFYHDMGLVGFLIFIFASYSAQRYLTEAANGTLALDVVLDIVFYKVLIALEMLLPVGLYVSVGVTLGQMYTDSEITAISAAGGSPGRLYKAVLYLAIPLSIFVTLLSMYGRPWAYAQIYQLEQQSQSELDVRQLRAKKFNTNDNGRMILSQTVDQDNNRLTDALIYTSTANRTRIFRARSVDVVDPSPEKPTVMLHNGTAYLLDHLGRDDNEQIYRNLQLHLNPLDQSPNVKRKAKSVTELARSVFPADHAELQWRQSRGLTALLMALLAISLSRVKPRQGRFSTLLPLTLLFVAIFYGGDVCRTLVANGAIPLIPGLWLVPGLMLMGLLMLVARDFTLLQKFSR